jgi:RES domain
MSTQPARLGANVLRHVDWPQAWRIIATRYPPINLFERVVGGLAAQEALIQLEMLTNPRFRNEIGDITLVAPKDRVFGPGASYVMASFTHVNPAGSRFSDGTYGVYYAGSDLRTALAETIHHFEKFARDASDPVRSEDMRVLVGRIDHDFEDVGTLPDADKEAILDPINYTTAQIYGGNLRNNGSAGIVYPSVREPAGECVAAFRPNVVEPPSQERHVQYHWDGTRIDQYFDYLQNDWFEWPGV